MKKLFVISILSVVACNQNTESNTSSEQVIVKDSIVSEHEHSHDEAILLDNGKKWKVVESMLVFIRNMESAVNEFESTAYKDYPALAKVIDKNIEDLTSNCTMTDQAHDELHKWLVPFIELSEDFDKAKEVSEQERIYKEFKARFKTFNTYFE
ncbi:MAG: hypothetical protein IT232_02285 [Flavobacteriales bacterium]|nr:hypothetical protein [Flavobacteriales bacterium]